MSTCIALIAALVIFARVEPVMNMMGRDCKLRVRVAFWLLAVGSAGLLLSITQGYRPDGATAATLAGIAVLLLVERRIRDLLGLHTRVPCNRRNRP